MWLISIPLALDAMAPQCDSIAADTLSITFWMAPRLMENPRTEEQNPWMVVRLSP
jgi:hypothetical protein